MNGTPQTKAQLGLGQIGLLRIGDRHDMTSRWSDAMAVVDFGLKWPYEPSPSCRAFIATVFGPLASRGVPSHQYPLLYVAITLKTADYMVMAITSITMCTHVG